MEMKDNKLEQGQERKQNQQLTLSRTMLQSLNLLKLDQLELAQFVEKQIMENPVLDRVINTDCIEQLSQQYPWIQSRVMKNATVSNAPGGSDPIMQLPAKDFTSSISFFLKGQASRKKTDKKTLSVCMYLIESLDEKWQFQKNSNKTRL